MWWILGAPGCPLGSPGAMQALPLQSNKGISACQGRGFPQDLHRVLVMLLCMDSHFLPDSWLPPMSLGTIFVACLHRRGQLLDYQQLPKSPGTQGGEVLQLAEQVRSTWAGWPHEQGSHMHLLRGRGSKGHGSDHNGWVRLRGKMRPASQWTVNVFAMCNWLVAPKSLFSSLTAYVLVCPRLLILASALAGLLLLFSFSANHSLSSVSWSFHVKHYLYVIKSMKILLRHDMSDQPVESEWGKGSL